MTRTTDRRAAWAIKLVSAQQPLPGVKAKTPAPVFRQTTVDGKAVPLLFSTREKARAHKTLNRHVFAASLYRMLVVPVRITTEEPPTLWCAANTEPGTREGGTSCKKSQ